MRVLVDPALTARQREVAVLLAEGRTTVEMAAMLTVTGEAVADDVDYLLRRLDRASRAKVASWATEQATRSWPAPPSNPTG